MHRYQVSAGAPGVDLQVSICRPGIQRGQYLGKQSGQWLTDHLAFSATEDTFGAEAEIRDPALMVGGNKSVRRRIKHALQLGLFMLQIAGLGIDPVLQPGLLPIRHQCDEDQKGACHQGDAGQCVLDQRDARKCLYRVCFDRNTEIVGSHPAPGTDDVHTAIVWIAIGIDAAPACCCRCRHKGQRITAWKR